MKILVVEDREENVRAAKNFFGTLPELEVVYAKDLAEAFEGLRERPDGVITDLFFPMKFGSGEVCADLPHVIYNYVMRSHVGDYLRTGMSITPEEHFKPLFDALLSGDEASQPSGVDVAEEAAGNSIPFVLATSEYHHGGLSALICWYQRAKGWPEMVDSLDKEKPEAWRKTYDRLIQEARKRGVELPQP